MDGPFLCTLDNHVYLLEQALPSVHRRRAAPHPGVDPPIDALWSVPIDTALYLYVILSERSEPRGPHDAAVIVKAQEHRMVGSPIASKVQRTFKVRCTYVSDCHPEKPGGRSHNDIRDPSKSVWGERRAAKDLIDTVGPICRGTRFLGKERLGMTYRGGMYRPSLN